MSHSARKSPGETSSPASKRRAISSISSGFRRFGNSVFRHDPLIRRAGKLLRDTSPVIHFTERRARSATIDNGSCL